MKIFLTKKSYFTFRGAESWQLDVLGKSVYEHMKERLLAEEEGEFTDEGVVLDPVYPFLTREQLFSYLDEREGSYPFPGGYLVRAGAMLSQTPRPATVALGPKLFSLADYASVLAYAAEESAKLHGTRGALVEKGAIVDLTAELREGAIIGRGSRVRGRCVIGKNAVIDASDLEDCEIGAGTVVRRSTLTGAKVGENCTVGPYAYLRAGSEVENDCRIGDFAELKNAKVGSGTKIAHLAYVGDAELGRKVNVGCGAVFVNYDGREKRHTQVGDGCFIGSNSNLIAPLKIAGGAFIAAGSTVTRDLAEEDFCIARTRETVKPGRGKRYYDPK